VTTYDVLWHVGFVLTRSKLSNNVRGHFILPPRPVLTTIAGCFPQILLGMLSYYFQYPFSSLCVFRFDGLALASFILWPPIPHGGIYPLPFIRDLSMIDIATSPLTEFSGLGEISKGGEGGRSLISKRES
jgi:hypothetical protein